MVPFSPRRQERDRRQRLRGMAMRSPYAGMLAGALLFALDAMCAASAGRWQSFPEPAPSGATAHPAASKKGCIGLNGIEMYYAVFGRGDAILLIHGGLGNADIWQAQVAALSATHQVIVADSRGHGRSTRIPRQALHYRQMADDYVALLARLGIDKVALVGWSDGAIIGLDIAMRYPEKLNRLFAHAANWDPSGLASSPGPAWGAYERWARSSHRRLASERCGARGADDFDGLKAALRPMWRSEPRWSLKDLGRIAVPTAIVLGDRDEAIGCGHTRRLASAIAGSRLLILPDVSHFAMRQDATSYNQAIRSLLDGGPPPRLGTCR